MSISRREVLALGGLGLIGAGIVTVPISTVSAKSASQLSARDMPRPYTSAFTIPPKLQPQSVTVDPDGSLVNHYNIAMRQGTAQILPRQSTGILGYNGTFPGPTIELDQGTRAVIDMRNRLPMRHPQWGHHLLATSTHLHGSASLPQFDGYASDVTAPGFCKYYQYPNFQAARTLWYHDHGVHFTAQNVYSGLAAMYIMHDPIEKKLLPQGDFDVPLIISDAMFAADGSLGFDDRDHSGLWGDVVLVNGRAWPVMKVQPRVYRFRVLNASISRSYRPSLSTGDPVYIVATDGGLMPASQAVTNWRHGSAERYEVLIDFSKYKAGTRVELRNLSNPNNRDYTDTNKIMAFDVAALTPAEESHMKLDPQWNRIPQSLAGSHVMSLTEKDSEKTRNFRVQRSGLAEPWTINGVTWEDVIASNFKLASADPRLDAVEVWEIENKSGGWFHPVHIHLIDFQILSRNGKAPFPWERGPKDVVYIGENEKVKVIMKFGPHKGRYMVHCHNLPHEDHSMMFQFRVGLAEKDIDDCDPILAAPPTLDPETD
ncbi:multicopper oxidase domain-containing protein [Arthrobacter sp. H5]|uniref:multicopper oxidase family protein n=1 Tax=Arthrobacter sp. H5 TaxID=1267973 RepID=UPI0004B2BA17|nr:multicopper oxidase domain-containing protein [Arthrobacter sp. H5]